LKSVVSLSKRKIWDFKYLRKKDRQCKNMRNKLIRIQENHYIFIGISKDDSRLKVPDNNFLFDICFEIVIAWNPVPFWRCIFSEKNQILMDSSIEWEDMKVTISLIWALSACNKGNILFYWADIFLFEGWFSLEWITLCN